MPGRRWERRGCSGPRRRSVCWREDPATSLRKRSIIMSTSEVRKTYVDHPVGNLAHAQTCSVAKLLFLLFAGIRVIGMSVQPRLEKVGCFLGQLTPLPLGTIDETRGRHGRSRTGWRVGNWY
jgi:hypothetical protein